MTKLLNYKTWKVKLPFSPIAIVIIFYIFSLRLTIRDTLSLLGRLKIRDPFPFWEIIRLKWVHLVVPLLQLGP